MKLQVLGKLVWAALSAGLALGLNLQLKPSFDPHYASAELSAATGTLTLAGVSAEIPLMTLHASTANVEHVGKAFKVRELMLRTAQASEGDGRVELFARLPEAPGDDLLSGPHNPSVFRQVELPVVASGRLGRRPSYVVLDALDEKGKAKHTPVVLGAITFSEIVDTESGSKPATYRVSGRVELQVDTEHGIDLVSGKLNGLLVWDDNPSATLRSSR